MAGFDHADTVGQKSMRIAGDDCAFERRAGRPVLLDRERHRCGGFARADDQRAAFGRRRQMLRHDMQRVGRGDCGFETPEQ